MRFLLSFPRLAFALVLVSIVGLCAAQNSVGFLLVAGTLAVLSWYITEGPRGRSLPKWVSNVLVIAVALNLFVELLQSRGDAIAALGRFTVWLTLIKLYQRKTARDHAQLLMLSLLLMLTGCLQSADLLFSVVLLIYTVLGVYVLMLYQLHKGYEGARDARQRAAPPDDRLAPALRPVAGRYASGHFKTLVVAVGVGGVLLSVFVFTIFPRGVGRGVVGDLPGPTGPQRIGFAEEIDLLRGGRITQSRDQALTVTLLDENGESVRSDAPLLLRGTVLDRYLGRGVWMPTDGQNLHLETGPAAEMLLARAPVDYRQHVVYHQWDDVLFVAGTPLGITTDRRGQVVYDRMKQTLRQSGSERIREYTVTSSTSLPVDAARQLIDTPPDVREHRFRHPQVRAIAIDLLRDAGLSPIAPRDGKTRWEWNHDAAAEFQRHLQQDGFQYTLDLGGVVARVDDEEFDPIVQFLTETRRGHCEYFASALTALCHSVDVPARIVTGFLAYQFDETDGAYHVLSSNAHAWTEVLTGSHEWTTFDASPSGALRDLHEVESTLADRLRWAYQRIEDAWSGGVVRFDQERQRVLIESLDRTWSARLSSLVRRIGAWMDRVNQAFYLGPAGYIWMGIVGFALVIAVIALFKVTRRSLAIRRTLQIRHVGGKETRRMLRQLGFYLDMLGVLERGGMAKADTTPPLAHADALARERPEVARVVRDLSTLFYESRFGGRTLDSDGVAGAAASVRELAALLGVRA